ncbi:MAG: hypothetical protein A4E58_01556 [Syntrophorhabdus sp. PtaB.Bin006]|nr:MAG: hypothetical protein A4E58_01556 [Syntrophorhabdus sp. PtaB.Bin006]
MRQQAANSSARGILGGLRGAVSVVYADRAIKGHTTAIDMAAVLDQVQLSGYDSSTHDPAALTVVISNQTYTYYLNETNNIPTTPPYITIQTATETPNW